MTLLVFPDNDPNHEQFATKHRSFTSPVKAAALFAGVDLSNAYQYANAYLAWATQPSAVRVQQFQERVEWLEALCIHTGPEAALQFHEELGRAFIEGRLRQSAFK